MTSEIEDHGSYRKARLESIRSVLCATCLSINRVLHPVAALRHLVPLLNDVGLDNVNNSICWECRAIMDKFHRFKNQAMISISILNSLVSKSNNKVCSLSNLRQSTKTYFDAQFSFHIKEEFTKFEDNDPLDMVVSKKKTCIIDIEPCHVKKEVFSLPSLQQETVPVEYSNKQLFITVLPLQVPSEGPKQAVPGSLGIPSQLPSTSKKAINSISEDGTGSDDDNHEGNVDEVNKDGDEEAKRMPKLNLGKKWSSTFSKRHWYSKILTEDEMLKLREEERQQTDFKNAKFRCMSCILYFESIETLDKHNLLHCPIQQGQFSCYICNQRFISQKAVMIHHPKHYRNYNCSYCSNSFYSLEQLITHWHGTHDPNSNRLCVDCGKEFRDHRCLKHHRKTVHSVNRPCIKCVECGKTFVNSANHKRHMLIHKGNIPLVECDICHKKFRGRGGLRQHMGTHEETQPENAYCTECDIQFRNVYQYRSHLKSNRRHVDPDTFKFQCSYCGKKFYCKTYISNHIQTVHLKLNNYECEQCNQTFHTEARLRKHHRDNHSGKPKTRNNICPLCGKAFIIKKSLTEHMNTHLGRRPFKCIECGATFAYRAALYTHTRLLHLKLKRVKKNSAAATVEQT